MHTNPRFILLHKHSLDGKPSAVYLVPSAGSAHGACWKAVGSRLMSVLIKLKSLTHSSRQSATHRDVHTSQSLGQSAIHEDVHASQSSGQIQAGGVSPEGNAYCAVGRPRSALWSAAISRNGRGSQDRRPR
eukprot:scaffold67922_cov69-Phaeocystis_antarctica.AAC.2